MSRMPTKLGNEQRSVKPEVRRLLSEYGWFWWGNTSGFGKSGISDTCALKNGVFLAIESKFGQNKATANQIGFLNSITMETGFGFVVNERTLNHLEFFLENFDKAVSFVRTSGGQTPGADIGGPLTDALAALTDYPKSLEEYAAQKETRRRRAGVKAVEPTDEDIEPTDEDIEPLDDDHDD